MSNIFFRVVALSIVLLFAGASQTGAMETSTKKLRPSPVAELPITIINNRVHVDFWVGGTRLAFLLDTGATSSIFFQSNHIDALNPTFTGNANLSFPAISRAVEARRIESMPLDHGAFRFVSLRGLYVQTEAAISSQLEAEYDAILGQEFFRAFVVEIDPLEKLMRLYAPGTNLEEYFSIKQKLYMEGHTPHIRFYSKMPWETRHTSKALLLDTGYPGSMVLWNRKHFALASRQGQMVDKKESSAGIVSHIKFDFGELSFENIPVFIARTVPQQSQKRDGLIGASLLAQYHHVIDFAHARIFMTPVFGSDGRPLQIIDGLIYTPNNEEFDLKTFYSKVPFYPTLVIYANGSTNKPD